MRLNDAQGAKPRHDESAARPPADGERLLSLFGSLVEHLGNVYPATTEIILHDLSRLPNSIVAISGNLTGRAVNGPATNYLLSKLRSGSFEDEPHYETTSPDGRRMQSSTMFVRDVHGLPVAALCINVDVDALLAMQDLVSRMLHPGLRLAPTDSATAESFPHTVDELSRELIERAIADVGVPVESMKKAQKMAVVSALEAAGFFLIREGAETAARALQVSKFTIYNYRNEMASGTSSPLTAFTE